MEHDPRDHDHAMQPNSKMCFVCGLTNHSGLNLRFFNDGPAACRADLILGDQFQGYPGIAHGGVVAAMLDEAMGRAPLSGDPNRFMYTAKIEIKYRQLVPLHQPLSLSGRIEKDRGRLVTAVAELRLVDGTIAAEANATLMAIPRETLEQIDSDAVGWRIYP